MHAGIVTYTAQGSFTSHACPNNVMTTSAYLLSVCLHTEPARTITLYTYRLDTASEASGKAVDTR